MYTARYNLYLFDVFRKVGHTWYKAFNKVGKVFTWVVPFSILVNLNEMKIGLGSGRFGTVKLFIYENIFVDWAVMNFHANGISIVK